MRVTAELRGIAASFSRASKRSSMERLSSAAVFFSAARFGASRSTSFLRLLFFSIELFFAISLSLVSASELRRLTAGTGS